MQALNLYDILGAKPGASLHELKQAYRRRARELHPDQAGPHTQQAMLQLNMAWQTLQDTDRRRAYDTEIGAAATEDTLLPHTRPGAVLLRAIRRILPLWLVLLAVLVVATGASVWLVAQQWQHQQRGQRITQLSYSGLVVFPKFEKEDRGKIWELHLDHNQLTELPAYAAALDKLVILNLSSNALERVHADAARLRYLHTLNLAYNRLTTLPNEMLYLRHLVTLDLSFNRLTRLPDCLAHMPNLAHLSLTGNPLPASELARIRKALPGTEIVF